MPRTQGLPSAATAILFFLTNKEAKDHASKKFWWLSWLGEKTVETIPVVLALTEVDAVDIGGGEEARTRDSVMEDSKVVEVASVNGQI